MGQIPKDKPVDPTPQTPLANAKETSLPVEVILARVAGNLGQISKAISDGQINESNFKQANVQDLLTKKIHEASGYAEQLPYNDESGYEKGYLGLRNTLTNLSLNSFSDFKEKFIDSDTEYGDLGPTTLNDMYARNVSPDLPDFPKDPDFESQLSNINLPPGPASGFLSSSATSQTTALAPPVVVDQKFVDAKKIEIKNAMDDIANRFPEFNKTMMSYGSEISGSQATLAQQGTELIQIVEKLANTATELKKNIDSSGYHEDRYLTPIDSTPLDDIISNSASLLSGLKTILPGGNPLNSDDIGATADAAHINSFYSSLSNSVEKIITPSYYAPLIDIKDKLLNTINSMADDVNTLKNRGEENKTLHWNDDDDVIDNQNAQGHHLVSQSNILLNLLGQYSQKSDAAQQQYLSDKGDRNPTEEEWNFIGSSGSVGNTIETVRANLLQLRNLAQSALAGGATETNDWEKLYTETKGLIEGLYAPPG